MDKKKKIEMLVERTDINELYDNKEITVYSDMLSELDVTAEVHEACNNFYLSVSVCGQVAANSTGYCYENEPNKPLSVALTEALSQLDDVIVNNILNL